MREALKELEVRFGENWMDEKDVDFVATGTIENYHGIIFDNLGELKAVKNKHGFLLYKGKWADGGHKSHKPSTGIRGVNIKVVNKSDNLLPTYESSEAACMDIRSNEAYRLKVGETKIFKTGLYLDIPSGYEVLIRPRSGLAAKHGITVLNADGVIDSDFKKEIGVILTNFGDKAFNVEVGDRIAQMAVKPVYRISFQEVESIEDNDRGGFGSTGIK